MKTILIIMYICGQPDTILWKSPDSNAQFTHHLYHPATQTNILEILKTDPVVIRYYDDRGVCA